MLSGKYFLSTNVKSLLENTFKRRIELLLFPSNITDNDAHPKVIDLDNIEGP